jgi:hypothetical protein
VQRSNASASAAAILVFFVEDDDVDTVDDDAAGDDGRSSCSCSLHSFVVSRAVLVHPLNEHLVPPPCA